VQDDEVAIQEDGIDRATHEPRVDRGYRPEKEALAFAERPTAEQAAQTSKRSLGDETPLTCGPSVQVVECDLH
jgi:hypothetical protein